MKRTLADVQASLQGEVLFGLHPILITLEQNRRSFHRPFLKDTLKSVDEGVLGKIVRLAEEKDIDVVSTPGQILDALSKGANHQVCHRQT